jgi:hypothetical protein
MRAVFCHVLIRLASKPPIQLQSGLRDGQQVGLVAVDVCLVLLRTLRTAVLMSALASCASTADPTDPDLHVHTWHQPVPVSAYLIALAVGQLAQRDLSPRVRVWAEPDVVEKAAFEFTQTEEFLTAAESLSCPYKYDLGYPISYLFLNVVCIDGLDMISYASLHHFLTVVWRTPALLLPPLLYWLATALWRM